jgi:hypothetical protein
MHYFDKNGLGYILVNLLQTHLVTLAQSHSLTPSAVGHGPLCIKSSLRKCSIKRFKQGGQMSF